jgi:hypothetical protein
VKIVDVVLQRPGLREQGEPGKDLVGGLEAHRDEPIDRQHQEQDVKAGTRFLSRMMVLLNFVVVFRHQRVEQPGGQQRDGEIDQGHGGRRPKVELAKRDLDQIDRQQRGRVARTAAGQHEGLGVDVEAVHEAQEDRDGQHRLHLRQLDVAEHRPVGRAVDLRRLIVGVGDRHQTGIGSSTTSDVQCQTSITMMVTQAATGSWVMS